METCVHTGLINSAYIERMDPDVLLSPASVSFRFHEILKTLAESDEGKLHILKVVYEVWRNHPQVKTCVCVCVSGVCWTAAVDL